MAKKAGNGSESSFTDTKRVKDLIALMAENGLPEIELVEDKAELCSVAVRFRAEWVPFRLISSRKCTLLRTFLHPPEPLRLLQHPPKAAMTASLPSSPPWSALLLRRGQSGVRPLRLRRHRRPERQNRRLHHRSDEGLQRDPRRHHRHRRQGARLQRPSRRIRPAAVHGEAELIFHRGERRGRRDDQLRNRG